MFSQFTHIRQAVENLAQQAVKHDEEQRPHSSTESQPEDSGPSSPAALRDPFVADLKKTASPQRPASPGGAARRPNQRSTLEDRLRAKLAAAHESNSSSAATSPSLSHRASPSLQSISAMDHPLSPTSTPLPQTPPPQSTLRNPLSPKSTPLPESPALTTLLPLRIDSPQPLALHTPEPAFLSTSPSSADNSDEKPTAFTPDTPATGVEPHEVQADKPSDATSSPPPAVLNDFSEGAGVGANAASSDADLGVSNSDKTSSTEELALVAEDVVLAPDTVGSSNPADIVTPDINNFPPSIDAVASVSHDTPAMQDAVLDNADHEPTPDSDSHLSEETTVATPPGVDNTTNNDAGDLAVLNGHSPERRDTPESDTSATVTDKVDIEALQKRLKLVEQRFTDVSTSFKRLQAEKQAADKVLQELTSVESIKEVESLRDYLQNADLKVEMTQDEIKRLNGKLTRQEERIEELRDIHRLESKSQSDLIDKLRAQIEEAEALLRASQDSSTQHEEETAKQKAEIERLQTENERLKGSAKEEEEKRVKAINLLKTVRQKLVKAEKDRDDAVKEVQQLREGEKEEREKDRNEKAELRKEIEKVNQEREVAVTGLRAQFDREVMALKDRYEREIQALKGQYELEAVTTKGSHTKEIEAKNSRILQLEKRVEVLSTEKDNIFDQLQLRQAELESARGHLESLEGQATEYQFQLREASEQLALLNEELGDLRRERETKGHVSGPSADEMARMLSTAESKYEGRMSELRQRLSTVERERDEGEAEWSRKLSEKAREVEGLKATLKASSLPQEDPTDQLKPLQEEIAVLEDELKAYKEMVADLRLQAARIPEIEEAAKLQLTGLSSRASALQQHLEDVKGREAQLKAQNKTLREELRKVQSSAALLEKQRGPGVGYWASRTELASESRSPRSSFSDMPLQDNSSRPQSPSTVKSDEEVNIEYLRNVVLQFLEHKEMRPQLVRIISTILRFTPQEMRRLTAKLQS